MALLEMRDTDLQELHDLLQLYSQTYDKHDITAILQHDIEQRCADRGIPCTVTNVRGAGRKRQYSDAIRDKIIKIYQADKSLTLRQIAAQVNVSYSTVQRIVSDYRFRRKTQN